MKWSNLFHSCPSVVLVNKSISQVNCILTKRIFSKRSVDLFAYCILWISSVMINTCFSLCNAVYKACGQKDEFHYIIHYKNGLQVGVGCSNFIWQFLALYFWTIIVIFSSLSWIFARNEHTDILCAKSTEWINTSPKLDLMQASSLIRKIGAAEAAEPAAAFSKLIRELQPLIPDHSQFNKSKMLSS